MANGYPNVWKDGWSSADHAETSYSPNAWERAQRAGAAASAERQAADEREARINESIRKREEAREYQRQHEEWLEKQREQKFKERFAKEKEAVNIIYQQALEEYKRKNFLSKAWLKLRGKSVENRRSSILEAANKRVEKMSDTRLDAFINREGRTR